MSRLLVAVGVCRSGSASAAAVRIGLRGRSGSALTLVVWSAAVLAVLSFLLVRLGGWFAPPLEKEPLLVYCASGLRAPVEEAARKYEQEYGVPVRLQYGSSGGLESTIEVRPQGDLVIPAGIDPFIVRMRKKGLVAEAIPLAQFRLVLAVRDGLEEKVSSLNELLTGSISYGLTNEQAASGKMTREALETSGDWVRIRDGARVVKPTVTDLAQDISLDVGVDAGFVWDATARQFGLRIVELPELRQSRSTITAGVLTASRDPAAALRFARYLAAPEKGQVEFARQHYESSGGDPWAVRPELTLFSGGVNRIAIQDTLEEFQQREGCRITVVYHGCGTLVGMMKAGQMPDAYFACDVSFVEQVRDQFFDPHNVSRTDMVILVKAGNPQRIKGLEDLARPGLSVGLADEKLSALGSLTKRMLDDLGLWQSVLENRRATTPTADLLVAQLVASDKLDAVVVYSANCSQVGSQGELVRIDHPLAAAVQPFAVHHENRYPQLTARFFERLLTDTSRSRFEAAGFQWLADPEESAEGQSSPSQSPAGPNGP